MTLEERLAEIFRAQTPGLEVSPLEPRLGMDIKDAIGRGRSAFPAFRLNKAAFVRHLAHALARRSDGATLSTLAIEDLYIACACVANVHGAVKVLVTLHGQAIRHSVERVVGKGNGEEIIQDLLSDLLVGSVMSPPELNDYSGRAPLVRWLEVVAHRAALRWQRTERAQVRVAGRAAMEPGSDAQTPTDAALFREQYGVEFQQALKEALKRVPQEDRALLRLHLVNNVSVEKIGKMLGVSQPTASRWLAKARERVLADTKGMLKARFKMSSREIESLAGLLRSRLDVSIARLLKTAEAQS